MGDKYFGQEKEGYLREWPFRLNRARHYLEQNCKQYEMSAQYLLKQIDKYQKRGLPAAVAEHQQRLTFLNAWMLEEINERRSMLYRELLEYQNFLINQVGLDLPAEQRVENTDFAKEVVIENNELIFLTKEEKEKRTQAKMHEIESEFAGEIALAAENMRQSSSNYIAPDERGFNSELERKYQEWLKRQSKKPAEPKPKN